MQSFRVWAPRAGSVDLLIGERRAAMAPEPLAGDCSRVGWWQVVVEDAGPGARYSYSLDGGPPRPDPRSPFQPDGVDGPSQVVDHAAFAWSDSNWRGLDLAAAVLYELHVGTFTPEGTFASAVAHLDDLAELGIDAVELLPVAEFDGERGWGYDGVDLYAPHHSYGGPDGLKCFVDEAHRRGIGVVMDVVYNHLGPSGNCLAEFGPYFTDRHKTNWGEAVNFDGAFSDEVRRFVVDNALMWLRDYHCDGLRLDAVHAIFDSSAEHVLEQLAREVGDLASARGLPYFLIAESDLNDPVFVRSRAAGGYGLDAAWADEFHHALHASLTGETRGYYSDFGSPQKLATAMGRAWVYAGTYSPHRRRVHGRIPRGLSSDKFVVFLQNHDQVGNRALGDRIGAQAGERLAKVGAALTLLSPFVPMIFQGEEWLASSPFQYFTDHGDKALGEAVSKGRREEFASFGWPPEEVPDPQSEVTFAASKLDWVERSREPHSSMLFWYRSLLALRHQIRGLTRSDPSCTRTCTGTDAGEEGDWLIVEWPGVVVVANLGLDPVEISLPRGGALALSSDPGVALAGTTVSLPRESVAVVRSFEDRTGI
ncbi:MAG: malto-oligosyltrehalose trehalohydrolase [Acidimicrobiales bacterium]